MSTHQTYGGQATVAAAATVCALSSESQRRLWAPPERIGIADWSEKYRYLSRRQTSRPGWWRNAHAPATVAFMVLCELPGIRQVSVLKHSQGGWSEAARNVIGKKAHLEPDPFLLVLPDKEKGKQIIHHRLLPMFQETAVLSDLATGRAWDQKQNEIVLRNGFVLRLGYSGSISSVSSDPARFVLNDERSKFQEDPKGSIADSIEARTSSYADSLIINLSTPLEDPDPTEQLVNAADIKLHHFVACPHCRAEQILGFDRLRWSPTKAEAPDKYARARRIRHDQSAWFECSGCGGAMTDRHRPAMLRAGYWATLDQAWRIHSDGRIEGRQPMGTTAGMVAPAWTSLMPKHSWSEIAARFVAAEGDARALRGVYNELLAQVFRVQTQNQRSDVFSAKCRPDPERGFVPQPAGVVPAWVSRILLTIDTQKDHFYYVVRGWGHSFRSIRLHHGRVQTFDELSTLADQTLWHYEGDIAAPLPIAMTAIDSGGGKMGTDSSRTDQVYRWCLRDPARRKPFKGESEPRDQPIRWRRVTYQPPGGSAASPYQTVLFLIDSHYFNDLLASHTETRIDEMDPETGEITGQVDQWQLNAVDDPEYNRHLAGMHKVVVRGRKGDAERWRPKTEGARIDWRMCEVYQEALAHGPAVCGTLPTLAVMLQDRRAMQAAEQRDKKPGLTMPDGRPFLATRR